MRSTLRSRSAESDLLRELNDDIWRAYRRAYHDGDAEAFLALHSPDLIRAGGPAKTISGFVDYGAITRQWLAELAERGDSVDIEFRFTERIVGADVASERGVYRLTARRTSGEQKVMYGQFHTFARKTDGRWRIAVDYDSDENATAEDFTAAKPMEDT
ncbi:MAG TPA: nuclear transport factor 2 family protein [Pseudonocardiaceae bacterium]|nr:nuclear transport factor 2 family protein [Pseudonocardiaceae bacterium]